MMKIGVKTPLGMGSTIELRKHSSSASVKMRSTSRLPGSDGSDGSDGSSEGSG